MKTFFGLLSLLGFLATFAAAGMMTDFTISIPAGLAWGIGGVAWGTVFAWLGGGFDSQRQSREARAKANRPVPQLRSGSKEGIHMKKVHPDYTAGEGSCQAWKVI